MGVDSKQRSDAEKAEEDKAPAGKTETDEDQVWLTKIASMFTIYLLIILWNIPLKFIIMSYYWKYLSHLLVFHYQTFGVG